MNKLGQPYRFQTAFAFVMLVTLALSSFVACVAQDMLPFVVERSVEVFPDARKNKAFSLKQGSALCNLYLYAQAPWRIDSSRIYLRDDKTLWSKRNAKEYFIAYAYAVNEYVAIRGDLSKRGKGGGKKKNEKPEFQVTVPKVNLQWDAKHGDASLEEKEDNVPAIIMVSEDANDFGSLIVNAPKDDMSISSPRVTLTWTEGEAIRVYEGEKEVKSGVSWPLMHGTHKVLSVKAIKPLEDVKFTLEGERDVVNGERAVDYVRAIPAKIEFVTPAGDPVRAPKDVGDGQNEFTFSTANPGVLTINLKAKVTPIAAAALMVNDCRFGVEAVGNSKMEWSKDNKGGKAAFVGGFLTATVKFIGLPEKNDAFGKKKAMLLWNGRKCDEENYEVFFPRDSENKQLNIPNWLFYWRNLVPNSAIVYVGVSQSVLCAEVEGMSRWVYDKATDKTSVLIYKEALHKGKPCGTGEEFSGIDMFIAVIKHEECHIQQIRKADMLLQTSGNDSFRFGWSWDVSPHNHWSKGLDNAWGRQGYDDDFNNLMDDASPIPPFEPGNGDDVSLEHMLYNSWPTAWPLPTINPCQHPIESEAVNAMHDAVDEHDYAAYDWGNPGKQHNTLNDWSN